MKSYINHVYLNLLNLLFALLFFGKDILFDRPFEYGRCIWSILEQTQWDNNVENIHQGYTP